MDLDRPSDTAPRPGDTSRWTTATSMFAPSPPTGIPPGSTSPIVGRRAGDARSSLTGALERAGVRIDPGRRAALAIGLVALAAAAVTGWWVLVGRPHAAVITARGMTSPASAGLPTRMGGSSGTVATATPVVVDVVGKVRRPGVYRLTLGSRVDDAVTRAGGALPGVDLTSLNLARKVADGEQIAVGVPASTAGLGGPAPGASATTGTGGSSRSGGATPGTPIDLNTATIADLDVLPGVGPVLAQHIVDWRAAHGRFDSIDQLREVSGIGPSKFASLRPLVTV